MLKGSNLTGNASISWDPLSVLEPASAKWNTFVVSKNVEVSVGCTPDIYKIADVILGLVSLPQPEAEVLPTHSDKQKTSRVLNFFRNDLPEYDFHLQVFCPPLPVHIFMCCDSPGGSE